MALVHCEVSSAVLGTQCGINVIVPLRYEDGKPAARKEYKVLYLLHGLSDNYSTWLRYTSIERYMAGRDVVVVMPDGSRSFYTDMKHGRRYWTFLSEELPAVIDQMFPVSNKREDTFVAGFSMGGYGTLKLALSHPERFAAAGFMSSVTDIAARFNQSFGWEIEDIFGSREDLIPDGNDIFDLLKKAAASPVKPAMYQFCGVSDYLYDDNVKLKKAFEDAGWENYIYEEHPGAHNWEFWDRHIQTIIKRFFD